MSEPLFNQQQQTEQQFMIQRIYIKDSSYETPNSPMIFQQEWEPELNLDLNTTYHTLENYTYEVVLSVTATVTTKKMTAFLIEIKQAGIFTIRGADEAQLDHLLHSFCPSILFPYAREAVTSQVTNGSFPQLVLSPINFDALYLQQQEEKKKAAANVETTTETTH